MVSECDQGRSEQAPDCRARPADHDDRDEQNRQADVERRRFRYPEIGRIEHAGRRGEHPRDPEHSNLQAQHAESRGSSAEGESPIARSSRPYGLRRNQIANASVTIAKIDATV